jgi:hypothetical protein
MRTALQWRLLSEALNKFINGYFALARAAGGRVKPGVERSGTPGANAQQFQARETGGSRHKIRRYQKQVIHWHRPLLTSALPPTSRAWVSVITPWGSAALHPRLYACTRCAG